MKYLHRYMLCAAAGLLAAASANADDSSRRLSLDDAVRLALAQNLTIQTQRLDPQIRDLSIAQARGAWTPAFQTTFNDGTSNVPSTSVFAGARGLLTIDQFNAAVGASQLLPWGASYSGGWNNARVRSNSPFDTPNPAVSSTLTGSYVQPLLKDFRIDAARQQLRLMKTSREMSDIQLQQTILRTVRSVKLAYWALAYATSSLAVQRQSLELARDSLRISRARLRAGMMAPVDVAEAESEVAQREEAVIVAEAAIGRAEDRLRALILDPAAPDFWTSKLEPIDSADADVRPVDIDAAVRNAMTERTDLRSARKGIDAIDVNVQFSRNQRLPDVRAAIGYALAGQGGTAWQFGSGFPPPAIGQRDIGYASALNTLFGGSFPSWSVSLTIGYPIRAFAANAAVARATLERVQALGQIRNLELQATTEVRDAGRQVNANAKRIEATAAARVLAEHRLEAEEKRFAAGMSTAFVVFQTQRDLTQARNAELRAMLDYKTSIAEFESIQATPSKEEL
jgi:outer membrane protein